jgi:type I restriction enzyme S subunit
VTVTLNPYEGDRTTLVPIGSAYSVTLGKMLDGGKTVESSSTVLPYIRAANIQDDGLRLADVNEMPFSAEEAARLDLRRGDLLVVEGGAVGTATIVGDDMPGWSFQKTVNRVRPINDWSTRYLAYVLRAYRDAGIIDLVCNGSTIPHLTAEKLRALRIPNAHPVVQCAIADYLDQETTRIDTLIREQRLLIEMLRERRAAVIAHATSHGVEVEFRRVIATLRQGWSPNCESWPADGVTEWGVLKVGCANTGRFQAAENKRLPDNEKPRPELAVRQGEIVMSRSNTKDLVGAAAVVDRNYPRLLLSDLTYGLSLTSDADPAFVAYALGSADLRMQISAASKGMSHSMQKISQRDIRELRVRLPALDEQRKVAAYLDEKTTKIDMLITESERFIDLARERRAALITAAVTGQIDVRKLT